MKLLYLFIILYSFSACAEIPRFEVIDENSSIHFKAEQNNIPVRGEFRDFVCDIRFDPKHLDKSKVKCDIDITSVTADYQDVAVNLIKKEWFNTESYPKAFFESKNFVFVNDKTYTTQGLLKIKEIEKPIILTFELEEYSSETAFIRGSATLQRTEYNVGTGEWSAIDAVADEVIVDITIEAKRKR